MRAFEAASVCFEQLNLLLSLACWRKHHADTPDANHAAVHVLSMKKVRGPEDLSKHLSNIVVFAKAQDNCESTLKSGLASFVDKRIDASVGEKSHC